MTDMLVKLYTLPPIEPILQHQANIGINIRRALSPEKHQIIQWVREHFAENWVSEVDIAYSRQPISCFIATSNNIMIGFGAYDTTALGFFGPTGVSEEARGKGAGKALLLACLHSMAHNGYGYAIIGGVGPIKFYEATVGATVIPDSTPGIYKDMLG